jgi:hypothetical protein
VTGFARHSSTCGTGHFQPVSKPILRLRMTVSTEGRRAAARDFRRSQPVS